MEIKQIDFAPDQKITLHRHPCRVVGYVARGTILFQVDGRPPTFLSEGSAFFEPAPPKSRISTTDRHGIRKPSLLSIFRTRTRTTRIWLRCSNRPVRRTPPRPQKSSVLWPSTAISCSESYDADFSSIYDHV